MQVARFWRMKKQTYRLEGVIYEDGTTSMTGRMVREQEVSYPAMATKTEDIRTKDVAAA